MEFASRQNGSCRTFWRGNSQGQSNRAVFSNSNSWNAPKTFSMKPMKFQYRGPGGNRSFHRGGARHGYNGRPCGGDYSWKRGQDCRSSGGVGRYRERDRWSTPLRPRENEMSRLSRDRGFSSCPRRRRLPSPSTSTLKRCRPASASPVCRPGAILTADKENVSRHSRESGAVGVQSPPPPSPALMSPSPRKMGSSGEPSKPVQLYGGKSVCQLQQRDLSPPASPVSKHASDPLYVGLPNLGNSCYQNATLQALLGVAPFVSESVATALRLPSAPSTAHCPTLRALSTLMVLRQQARRRSVSSHVNRLREVFAAIDPAFRGSQMQDANEFLLRLLDTLKDELDASERRLPNPVRSSFEYETQESYRCCRCGHQAQRRQANISWFVNVPRRSHDARAPPTLQDALRLSMRPDERELTCEQCGHTTCTVATRVTRLPRVLILQLNRYVYLSEQSRKIRSTVQIPRFISLNEYVSDDVASPAAWECQGLPAHSSSLVADVDVDAPVSPSVDNTLPANHDYPDSAAITADSPIIPSSPDTANVHNNHESHANKLDSHPSDTTVPTADVSQDVSSECTSPSKVADISAAAVSVEQRQQAGESTSPLQSPEMTSDQCDGSVLSEKSTTPVARSAADPTTPPMELVVLDGDQPGSDEERQLQEAIRLSLQEQQNNEDGDKLIEYCVEDDLSRCSVDLAGDDTYRLMAVVSHYGSATHSGHYVSDVYSVARQRWLHYDDRRVCDVTEDDVIGETHQRNGYIFFYMHKSVCAQVATIELFQC